MGPHVYETHVLTITRVRLSFGIMTGHLELVHIRGDLRSLEGFRFKLNPTVRRSRMAGVLKQFICLRRRFSGEKEESKSPDSSFLLSNDIMSCQSVTKSLNITNGVKCQLPTASLTD